MTFDEIEASAADGGPYFLYLFIEGDQAWRFTSRAQDWLSPGGAVGGDPTPRLWAARAISHERITHSGDAQRADVTVALPVSDAFVRRYLAPRNNRTTSLTIFRGHEQIPTVTRVHWIGEVRAAAQDSQGQRIELRCESLLSALQRPGLARQYSRTCTHPHYGRGCRLDLDDFAVPATATEMVGTSVTVPEAASSPDGWYTAGLLRFDGLGGWITAHSGDVLTLLDPLPALAEALAGGAQAIDIAPGCDLRLATCENKFANTPNFGGFPDIPDINFFDGLSVV